jgi:DNA invertase Pin-like site-specific DNA recombinase
MGISEIIRPLHHERLAIVYVRQSSPHQVINNQESLDLQYKLGDRAQAAGWSAQRVRIIDTDLGRSARTVQNRPGFQELVALVNDEKVGVIYAYDVTRLARNCTDWYHLLDLCGYRNCLVGDQDSIYDPATPNGRLILGLKGLISEMESYTLRARLLAGRLNKAQRGDLALPLPVGLVRDALKRVVKHPNREVQNRIDLVFSTFQKTKVVAQVVRHFDEHHLLLPRRDRFGDLVWRRPAVEAILGILKNPAYAGAFVYGRSQVTAVGDKLQKFVRRPLPIEQWKICHKDKYPAYIDWDRFVMIQTMIRDNHSDYESKHSRGVPRCGPALLQGIVYCGACGHKMLVQYKRGPRYVCNHFHRHYEVSECQRVPVAAIDSHVVKAFLEALAPLRLDLYDKAVAELHRDAQHIQKAQEQQLQRLRYQARLAQRQFDLADPENRLVTAELEKRWEAALQELRDAEERFRGSKPSEGLEQLSAEEHACFIEAGRRIPELWQQQRLSLEQQKSFLRCLIDKVVVQRCTAEVVEVRVVWRGGMTSSAKVSVPVSSLAQLSGTREMEQQILKLARKGKGDKEIAALLSKAGHRSAHHVRLTPSTVQAIRLKHGVLRAKGQSHPRHLPGYLTVAEVARKLRLNRYWVHNRIRNGKIDVARDRKTKLYLFPNKPRTLALFEKLRTGKLHNLHF